MAEQLALKDEGGVGKTDDADSAAEARVCWLLVEEK